MMTNKEARTWGESAGAAFLEGFTKAIAGK